MLGEEWTHPHPSQERVHLNPMLGEDSEHTVILLRTHERIPTSCYRSGEDTPRSCVGMGDNTSTPTYLKDRESKIHVL